MGEPSSFWREVLRQAWRSYFSYLKSSREHIIGFAITSAIVFTILYWVPRLGNWRDEFGPTAAAAIAVMATAALRFFLVDLLRAPARVYRQTYDRARKLENILARDARTEEVEAQIHELYWEGRRMYEEQGSYDFWKGEAPLAWLRRARDVVEQHYGRSILFIYDTHDRPAHLTKKVGIDYPAEYQDMGPILKRVLIAVSALESISIYPPKLEQLQRQHPEILDRDLGRSA